MPGFSAYDDAQWRAEARAVADRIGVDADVLAADVHRGDNRLREDVDARSYWVPVLDRLRALADLRGEAARRGHAARRR